MAEEENGGQEKTEQATQQKLDKAREEGQVPRSKELNTLAILVAGCFGLIFSGPLLVREGRTLASDNFGFSREMLLEPGALVTHLSATAGSAVLALVPFFAIVLIAAFAGPVSLGGWLVSGSAVMPKLSRMDPVKGLGRMFSMNALVELGKAVLKLLTVAGVSVATLYIIIDELQLLGFRNIEASVTSAAVMIVVSFLLMSLAMILIAIVDVPFQIFQHSKQLRMTRQEVKEELKNTEGRPEVKSKIRQLQQEMASKRMMNAVPDADVVITNPTHFAVALQYDAVNMSSPRLVAKGADNVAAMIREVADANNVPQVSFPLLARALFFTTDLEAFIPEGLYLAVAQVLAYVFQLRQHRRGQGPRPRPLAHVDIPAEFEEIARQKQAGRDHENAAP